MTHTEMKGFGYLIAALVVIYVIWRLTKRRIPPIPKADRTMDLGSGQDRVVYGYHRASNTISIWSPKNPVVRVCRSRFKIGNRQATQQEIIGGYRKQYLVTGTTTDGTPFQGYGEGESVAPMEITKNKDGYRFVWASVTLNNRKPIFEGDSRQLFDESKANELVPPVNNVNEVVYWSIGSEVARVAADVANRFQIETEAESKQWFASRGVHPQ